MARVSPRLPHLIMAGWKPMKPMLVVNWCGHGQRFIPWPEADGYWTLVPVLGEAACEPLITAFWSSVDSSRSFW